LAANSSKIRGKFDDNSNQIDDVPVTCVAVAPAVARIWPRSRRDMVNKLPGYREFTMWENLQLGIHHAGGIR
jgi:hypothetical protein